MNLHFTLHPSSLPLLSSHGPAAPQRKQTYMCGPLLFCQENQEQKAYICHTNLSINPQVHFELYNVAGKT